MNRKLFLKLTKFPVIVQSLPVPKTQLEQFIQSSYFYNLLSINVYKNRGRRGGGKSIHMKGRSGGMSINIKGRGGGKSINIKGRGVGKSINIKGRVGASL